MWTINHIQFFGILLVIVDTFIVPPDPEPVCPGITCTLNKVLDLNTCRCTCKVDSACSDETSSISKWPTGQYEVPASMYGCPEITWTMRYINLTLPSDDIFWTSTGISFDYIKIPDKGIYNHSRDMHILGPYSTSSFQFNFCSRNDIDSNLSWPIGNYCVFGVGTECPNGFGESNLTLEGYNIEARGFPNGVYNSEKIIIPFCCKDEDDKLPLDTLPTDFPFVLIKGSGHRSCQQMIGMEISEDTIYLPKKTAVLIGTLPELLMTDTHIGLTFCYYQPKTYAIKMENSSPNITRLEIFSEEMPVYSSPYTESATNSPHVVVQKENMDNTFTTSKLRRPWIQIDLQQSVRVNIVTKYDLTPNFSGYFVLCGIYVSMKQWDFTNRGARACFFGSFLYHSDNFVCRRPITGQYITLVLENDEAYSLQSIHSIKVYGERTGCGQYLGMISGDIKEFQFESSSNQKDIPHIRALHGTQGWCSHESDKQPWFMIDLIVPTNVQAVVLHGWHQQEHQVFINKFIIEYGVKKTNLSFYTEENEQPKVFRVNTGLSVYSLQKFWFWESLITRYVKIRVVDLQDPRACMKIELVGCPVYFSRATHCSDANRSNKILDFGFASIRNMNVSENIGLHCKKDANSILECQNKTVTNGFLGNSYDNNTNMCCLFNVSMYNRHFSHLWQRVADDNTVVSEQLCLANNFPTPSSLSKNVHVLQSTGSGMLHSPMFPSNYPRGIKMRFEINGQKMFIKLTIVYVSLSKTATESYLRQIGNLDINPSYCQDKLAINVGTSNNITITNENQNRYRYASFISATHTTIIDLTTCFQYRSSEELMYQIQYENVDYPGCGIDASVYAECTSVSAFLSSYLYPSMLTSSELNTWKIRVYHGQYIELYFIDFNTPDFTKTDAYIEVFDSDKMGHRSGSLGRFITMPYTSVKSSWHVMDVEFRGGSEVGGRGFFGRYEAKRFEWTETYSNERCKPGQQRFEESCYAFLNDLADHQQAEKRCQNDGSHLVSIGSEKEMKFLFSKLIFLASIIPGTDFKVHIGLVKHSLSQLYTDIRWTNGETVVYTAWFEGSPNKPAQPDGFLDERCAVMAFDSANNIRNWHDIPCSYKGIQFIVCENELDSDIMTDPVDSIWNMTYEGQTLTSELGTSYYVCYNGEIVSEFAVCDSFQDCSDKSDEIICTNDCSDYQFQCDDRSCIHWTHYCDHVLHCKDGSDENDCSWPECNEYEWTCSNKQCIPLRQKCDSVKQCIDGSDERNCGSECSTNAFQCFDGSCLSWKHFCDGIADCPGKFFEDEYSISQNAVVDLCSQNRETYKSCEEWWSVGARRNGTYTLHLSDDIKVYCVFEVIGDKVNVKTYVLIERIEQGAISIPPYISKKYKIYRFSELVNKIVSNLAYQCSQTIEMTCYYQDSINIDRHDTSYEKIKEACNGRCRCIGVTDWSQADINLPVTEKVTVSDSSKLPVDEHALPFKKFSDESFYSFDLGPVVCSSEIPVNETLDIHMCTNKINYNYTDRCILYKDYIACRDMSHVQDCDDFICPLGFYKCPQSFCISSDMVCDGIKHCRHGNDELNCGFMRCPGFYRCQRSTICLKTDKVCDGVHHCPMGDDESECHMKCPINCSCSGNAYICHNMDVQSIFKLATPNVRKLDLSHSKFADENFSIPEYKFVGELIFHNCSIHTFPSFSFSNITNLLYLDLSNNLIETLYANTFSTLVKLRILNFEGNRLLRVIEPMAFKSLQRLKTLNITDSKIEVIEEYTFVGLENLQFLNLSNNSIRTVKDKGFHGLQSLQRLDITSNSIEIFSFGIFSPLNVLKYLESDSFLFCCLKPTAVADKNCHPKMDEFSSCSDLMRSDVLRVCLWIIGVSAFIGNFGVTLYRLGSQRHLLQKAHWLYILNLSIADLLMGIYLIIIATADVYYKGNYILHDRAWRRSPYCKLAGVLAMMSAEASVTFIMLITIDFFLKVKFPFGNRKITSTGAILSCIICWTIVLFVSILPVFYTSYFSEYFYSATAVCLALPLSSRKTYGWEYSAAIFIFYNSMAFLTVAFCQYNVYSAAKSSNRIVARKSGKDLELARRLFLIVFTDFLCWFPIGILGILTLAGHIFPSEVYSWVAVFVMPINAALNPLLYTFSALFNRKVQAVANVAEKLINKSLRKHKDSKADFKMASIFLDRHEDMSIEHCNLTKLFEFRLLRPNECYFIISTIVGAVAYLHQKGYTLEENLRSDSVVVFIDSQQIVQAKIISPIKDINSESDTSKDIEGIGKITKLILRYANQNLTYKHHKHAE